jgi:hypothetical protein
MYLLFLLIALSSLTAIYSADFFRAFGGDPFSFGGGNPFAERGGGMRGPRDTHYYDILGTFIFRHDFKM